VSHWFVPSIAAVSGGVIKLVRRAAVTIRGKILFAFCALAALTGFLGLYAVNSVVESGRLVVETYDKPLMSISYTRLALSSFTAMQLALADRVQAAAPQRRSELDDHMAELAQSVAEDLAVTEERSLSPRAALAANATAHAVADWDAMRRRVIDGKNDESDRLVLQDRAAVIGDQFDNLVELTAEDGFKYRESALNSIDTYRRLSIAATFGALMLGGVIAIQLARRMVRPIADASRAAERIAAGELDVEIGTAGGDELGRLLASMVVMRDNIRSMMDREITARRSAQTRLVNAIESTAEGVILVDSDRHILISNSQVRVFFPDLGENLTAGAPLPEALEKALAEPSGELRAETGRWLNLSRSATPDGGFVVIVSDISALKEREGMLQAAKEQAEAASRAKTEFLANMGHELRTPLNAVIGFSEIIAGEMLGPVGQPSYKEFATDIQRSGNNLLQLINDILDFAKSERGNLEIMPEPTEASVLLARAAEFFKRDSERGGVTLEVAPAGDPLWLLVDPARTRRIVHHLLSNAIKFTATGGRVTLSAHCVAAGRVAIAVADTGIGMRMEDIPLALSPFSQVDGGLSRKYEGTGIGLPLCKALAELHGGSLTIESAPNQGTTVTVVLPEAVHESSLAAAS